MSELPTYPIPINSFEVGMLMGLISKMPDDRRRYLERFFTELTTLMQKFRDEESVKIENLGNNMIKMTDKSGATVVRERYKWEQ